MIFFWKVSYIIYYNKFMYCLSLWIFFVTMYIFLWKFWCFIVRDIMYFIYRPILTYYMSYGTIIHMYYSSVLKTCKSLFLLIITCMITYVLLIIHVHLVYRNFSTYCIAQHTHLYRLLVHSSASGSFYLYNLQVKKYFNMYVEKICITLIKSCI